MCTKLRCWFLRVFFVFISLGLFGVPCIFLRKRKGKGVSYGSIDKGDMCVLILVTCIFSFPWLFFLHVLFVYFVYFYASVFTVYCVYFLGLKGGGKKQMVIAYIDREMPVFLFFTFLADVEGRRNGK